MAATKKRPIGRPLELQRVYMEADGDKEEILVADRIIAAVRAGNDLVISAASVGINKDTLRDYLATGARTLIAQASGKVWVHGDFTAKEHACAEFSARVTIAQSEFEIATNMLIDRVARGGIPTQTTTVKRGRVLQADGTWATEEIERTVKTSTTLPDWKAAMQRLIYRHPDRYARNRLELHVGDAPLTDPMDIADDEAVALAFQALHATPIETTAAEVEPELEPELEPEQ